MPLIKQLNLMFFGRRTSERNKAILGGGLDILVKQEKMSQS